MFNANRIGMILWFNDTDDTVPGLDCLESVRCDDQLETCTCYASEAEQITGITLVGQCMGQRGAMGVQMKQG